MENCGKSHSYRLISSLSSQFLWELSAATFDYQRGTRIIMCLGTNSKLSSGDTVPSFNIAMV